MRRRRLSFATAVAVLAGLTAAAGPGVGASYASSGDSAGTPLPLAHFSHMVVDGLHGHVFISGGAGSDSLVVTDLDGANPTTISGEPGATGLALSADGATLYAALPDSDAISAISTDGLAETARYATGDGTRPDSLAVAGGALWFGYGASGAGGIGSVGADGGVKLGQDSGSWAGSPMLAGTPTASDELAGVVGDGAGADAVTYKIVDGALTRQAAKALNVADPTDLAVTADGVDLALTSGAGQSAGRFRVSDLETNGGFGFNLGARAVAVAPDSTLATSSFSNYERGYTTLPSDGGGQYSGADFDDEIAVHGVRWAPDGTRLYAVTADASGGAPALHVDTHPAVARLSYRVEGTTAAPGESLSLTFVPWTSADPENVNGGVLPGTLRITRYDDAHPDGVPVTPTLHPSNVVNFIAWYTLDDTVPLTGALSYRVEYSGSTHYTASDQTFPVTIQRYAPTLKLTAPTTSARAKALTVTGSLGWPHAHVLTGAVHVVKTDAAHPSGYSLGTVPVAADGTFALHDTPQIGGADSYAFRYDGGTSYLPASATAKVDVSRAAPAVTVATNAASYHSGSTVKVTAHLGTTYNSRTVAIYATPVGKARTLVRSGKVDSHGNLSGSYKISRNTVFSASFGGDYRYAPRTASRTAVLAPTVKTELQWPLGTTRIGSTTYHVFRKSEVNMGYDFKVSPTPTSGCGTVYIEHYYSHAWHKVTSTSCVPVYSDHWYGYGRALKLFATNGQYRIRGHYAPPTKGAVMGSVWTGWTYLVVKSG